MYGQNMYGQQRPGMPLHDPLRRIPRYRIRLTPRPGHDIDHEGNDLRATFTRMTRVARPHTIHVKGTNCRQPEGRETPLYHVGPGETVEAEIYQDEFERVRDLTVESEEGLELLKQCERKAALMVMRKMRHWLEKEADEPDLAKLATDDLIGDMESSAWDTLAAFGGGVLAGRVLKSFSTTPEAIWTEDAPLVLGEHRSSGIKSCVKLEVLESLDEPADEQEQLARSIAKHAGGGGMDAETLGRAIAIAMREVNGGGGPAKPSKSKPKASDE